MSSARIFCIIFIITACSTNDANGVDKYTDENRPYEFGFTIDGEQHRHEKKDENGLIMGEFGFITADGVYHVTVYATDENGRFKILSMKNIRVKPYPTAPTQSPRTGHSLLLTDTQKIEPSRPIQMASYQANKNQPINNDNSQTPSAPLPMPKRPAAPVKSCSHCSLPTTTTTAPKVIPQTYQIDQMTPNIYINQDNNFNNNRANQNTIQSQPGEHKTPSIDASTKFVNNDKYNSQAISTEYINPMNSEFGTLEESNNGQYSDGNIVNNDNKPNSQQNIIQTPSIPQNPSEQNYKFNSAKNVQEINPDFMQQSSSGIYNPQNQGFNILNNANGQELESPYEGNQQKPEGYPQEESSVLNLPSKPTSGDRNPKSYEPSLPYGQQNALGPQSTPKLISAHMQIVDKNTDIYHKNAGETDGLPEGVSKDYMMRVLYVFNYTVGFHGHYEKGFSDGSKQGYYYVTGRNGIRTRVDYEADEKGFRPKITQEVLDLLSDDVPKPETEKEPKYGLKSYEFKWLYFPVESKQLR